MSDRTYQKIRSSIYENDWSNPAMLNAAMLIAKCPNRYGVYETPIRFLLDRLSGILDRPTITEAINELQEVGFLKRYRVSESSNTLDIIWIRDHFLDDNTKQLYHNTIGLLDKLGKWYPELSNDFIAYHADYFSGSDFIKNINKIPERVLELQEKGKSTTEYVRIAYAVRARSVRLASSVLSVLSVLSESLKDLKEYISDSEKSNPLPDDKKVLRDVKHDVVPENISGKESLLPDEKKIVKPKPEPKRLHGTFVRLTDADRDRLISDFGESALDAMIQEMNDWLFENKPGGYKDYNAQLRRWFKRNGISTGNFVDESPVENTEYYYYQCEKCLLNSDIYPLLNGKPKEYRVKKCESCGGKMKLYKPDNSDIQRANTV